MNKKGDVWISAALYTALGVILITLILTVGMPFIDKIKMRNTVLQTKNVMYDLDEVIRTVNNEGYGSRRPIFVDIGAGDFVIDATANTLTWSVVSEEQLGIEPNVGKKCDDAGALIIEEGNLNICSEKLGQGYKIKLYLDYENDGIEIETSIKSLSGKYNLVVQNNNGKVEIRSKG